MWKWLSFSCVVFLETPVSILRGVYVHLRRRGFVARNKQKLLDILEPEGGIQVPSFASLEPMDGMVTAEWRAGLCEDLSKGLFSNEGLCRTRLKLNMAMACSVRCFVFVVEYTHSYRLPYQRRKHLGSHPLVFSIIFMLLASEQCLKCCVWYHLLYPKVRLSSHKRPCLMSIRF
jgi:hypothetical protein